DSCSTSAPSGFLLRLLATINYPLTSPRPLHHAPREYFRPDCQASFVDVEHWRVQAGPGRVIACCAQSKHGSWNVRKAGGEIFTAHAGSRDRCNILGAEEV